MRHCTLLCCMPVRGRPPAPAAALEMLLRTKDGDRADGAQDQPLPPEVHSQGRDRDQSSLKLPALTLTCPPSPICEASLSPAQPHEPGAYAPSSCLGGRGHHPGSHLPAACNQQLCRCHMPPHPIPAMPPLEHPGLQIRQRTPLPAAAYGLRGERPLALALLSLGLLSLHKLLPLGVN
ncbi:putative tRNA (cytidine(32)/guanosine(34)-2'-O)-methyltransferase-like [Platysternon megacephalum]|uniref:Putative tRNA (Cytidine(32)/guanosine(34)-2'-O)-methyltransferase-like n=1 Tax=Platysternon megacephalum TaxID=55544 RepID=A0A4D9DKS9_9SAUR|nr:putative tRNA (cytidine(32)/guanosine(34)-2'-O)-methyltransferase-like [Platysternon megacephalum]